MGEPRGDQDEGSGIRWLPVGRARMEEI